MRITIKKLLPLLFLLAATTASAQLKIVESSARRAPVWFNTMQPDYIITSAIADDIERAKTQCLDNVRNYIIDAVAQNVKASTESTITQESVNTGIVKFLDEFTTSYQTQSANMPYLSGISMSRVEDSYWQKRQDKKTKAISYLYSIKYPFPTLELKKLTHEFKKRDAEMNEKFAKLEAQLEDISSVEQIEQSLNELTPLIAYFFDDIRRNAALTLQRSYVALYDELSVERASRKLGDETFAVILRGKRITSAKGPSFKSETLSQLESHHDGELWRLEYTYSGCNPAEENFYDLTWKLGRKTLRNRFYINLGETQIDILPKKEIYLLSTDRSDSTVTNVRVRMNLVAGDAKRYTVRNITLNVPALRDPILLDNLNVSVEGEGAHNLELTWLGSMSFAPKHSYQVKLVRGHMDVEIPNGSVRRIDFSLPLKTNW